MDVFVWRGTRGGRRDKERVREGEIERERDGQGESP